MRRWLALALIVALLGAGCTSAPDAPADDTAPPAQADSPGPGSTGGGGTETDDAARAEPSPPGSGGGAEAEPASSAPDGEAAEDLARLVAPAPDGAVLRLTPEPGSKTKGTGLYLLDVATGEVEGWAAPSIPHPSFDVSPDNRWVTAGGQEVRYLVDRQTGAVWQLKGARVVAARGDSLLLASAGAIWLAGPTLKARAKLPMEPVMPEAAFSPDGETLVLVSGAEVYLVDAATGEHRPVADLGLERVGPSVRMRFFPRPDGVDIVAQPSPYGAGGREASHTLRLSWQGEVLAHLTGPAPEHISPDGKLAAWTESLSGFTRGVVVARASDLTPLFRVRAADFCTERGVAGNRWLADSSGIVIRTRDGHRIATTEATLKPLAVLKGTGTLREPVPAPDRPDLFAIGRQEVRTAHGEVLQAVDLSPDSGLSPWGDRSDVMRLALLGIGGKGPRCGPLVLPPNVERPPFPAVTRLMVDLPEGDCLNLRLHHSTDAPVIACLPGGTLLTAATSSPGTINKGALMRYGGLVSLDMGGQFWLYVRTPEGSRGFVSFSGEWLTWAPFYSDAAPYDPVAAHIGDETAALRFWLQAALGEVDCGPGCPGGPYFGDIVLGIIGECTDEVNRTWSPASLRSLEGYDPARHEGLVAPVQQACTTLTEAHEQLGGGYPPESEAWRERVRQALEALAEPGTE